jgi:hypothetical protein
MVNLWIIDGYNGYKIVARPGKPTKNYGKSPFLAG